MLSNPGFENPFPDNDFGSVWNPATVHPDWTFGPGNYSGIQKNGSTFVAPMAPEGVQTAFIRGNGTISQTVYFPAGIYFIGFQAAKRTDWEAARAIDVYFDEAPIASFKPTSASFMSFTTKKFKVTAGSHTI